VSKPAGRLRTALTRISLTRALVALAMLLVAINVASAVWDMRMERERTERDALRAFSNLTNLLSEQTAATLEAADLVLRDSLRSGSKESIAAAMPRFRDELAHMPQIAGLLVLDERGQELAATSEFPAIDPDFSKQSLFTAHRDGLAKGLFVSPPYVGGPVGTNWRFVLSRRINGPGERFGGVIAVVIEVESFDQLYRSVDLGKGGFITLLALDGMIITRVPDHGGARGRHFPAAVVPQAYTADGRFQGWTTSPILNERVLLSATNVRGFPFQVMSGSTERSVFAPLRAGAWLIGARTLLSSAAMLALVALAAWGLARRERALRQSEKRYRAMIEHSADAVILTRPGNGGIFYASPSVERLIGYSLEELRGLEASKLVHPDHLRSETMRGEDPLAVPGALVTNEVVVQCRDGSSKWIEYTASNLLHEASVGAVVMNFRDISERKSAEAERTRLEQRLRQAEKMEAVGRLAGGIAHDFNNILGGILGYVEMLVEGTAPGSALRRYAGNVLTAANRASALVEQILWYSRSQSGKRVTVELNRTVAEALELVRGSLAAGIRLEADLPAKPLCVVGDPTQLHQVIMNLCTNAIHAMGEHGTLRVTLAPVEVTAERTLTQFTLQPGSYAKLTIEDTGAGMDAATLARVFEPFFTTKEVGKGTGLGLSLVYGIVTDASGAIDAASEVGRGSTFTIYLPSVESAVESGSEDSTPIPRGHGETILLVDDEKALVAVTSESLKHLGYEPVPFADGATALAGFEADPERYDAVITDEVMSGLSGTELARSLRQRRADLPIVLVSGYVGPIMTERAATAGVNEILKKPLHSRDIAAALARVLRRAREA
jgi:PAS domain S-box-containing protein